MARKEFAPKVKAQAFQRAAGFCEGEGCGVKLSPGKFHYDHDNPDGLTGEPTLENCKVLCLACHGTKTKKDQHDIAQAKRRERKHVMGIRQTKGRPLPGTKASGLRKRMNGQVERRT